MPALPSWLTEPLWDQFVALLPKRPQFHPDHPLGCHRRRISDRIIFDSLTGRPWQTGPETLGHDGRVRRTTG
ncbi:hypothetical protein GCM10023088_68330 [Actinomadura verrucosospora]